MDDFYSEMEKAKITDLAVNGIIVDWLSGLCPVQATGYIDRHFFYFRARGDMWELRINDNQGGNVEDLFERSAWHYQEDYKEFPEAGYMPFIEALDFIEKGADRFRNGLITPNRGKGLIMTWRDFRQAIRDIRKG